MSAKIRKIIGRCLLSIAIMYVTGCSSTQNYPASDHFDGTRFFNPENPEGNDIWAGMKLLFSFDFAPWPENVENKCIPKLHSQLSENEISVTFVNHATMLIQSKNFNILTDPVWSDRVSPFSWIGPKRHRKPGLAITDLPNINLVLISHNHYDHLDIETLKKINKEFHPFFIVPLGNKKILDDLKFEHVREIDWWQKEKFTANLNVTLTPAMHISGRGLFDKNRTLWGGYFISLDGHSVYFAGDTGYASHFSAIRKRLGSPDIALLPIGAYEPRWFMRQVHMNPDDAVQAHLDLGAKQSIAMHFGTFQLTNEGISQPTSDLNKALERKNVQYNAFLALEQGETRIFRVY